MEEWLEQIIEESKNKVQEALKEMKGQSFKMSMNFEAGKEKFGFDLDLKEVVKKIMLPAQLFGKGLEGINNVVDGLGFTIKKDYKIKGYSESEYVIPYYLETKEKLILLDPLYFSGFMEAIGLGYLEYAVFAPFLALEFFKYIDIMNAQKKPTVMAFLGLTDFIDFNEVNFFDFIKSQLKNYNIAPQEDIQKNMKEQSIYGINPQNMFKTYGIPKFQVKLVDALKLSSYDPKSSSDSTKIKAYAKSMGIYSFLNPSIIDYPLFVTNLSGKTNAEVIGDIMYCGKKLGHSPSKSELLPEVDPKEVLDNPLILMKECKKLGLVTEIRGTYKLSNKGFQLVNAEISGKPKEWSLSKIWNMAKKRKKFYHF